MPGQLYYPPNLFCLAVFPSHILLMKDEFVYCETATVQAILVGFIIDGIISALSENCGKTQLPCAHQFFSNMIH